MSNNIVKITNTTSKNLRNIIINTNNKLENYKIALIVPASSNNTNFNSIQSSSLNLYLIDSFLKTADKCHQYKIFLGIDRGDIIYDNITNQKFIKEKLVNSDLNITIDFIYLDTPKGELSRMWNILAEKAFNENYEYFYQLGDDVEFSHKNWVNENILNLKKMSCLGITGSVEKRKSDILTQSFCHRTHYMIFNKYFPEEFKNWYIDGWISNIYKTKYYKPIINQPLINHSITLRYKPNLLPSKNKKKKEKRNKNKKKLDRTVDEYRYIYLIN